MAVAEHWRRVRQVMALIEDVDESTRAYMVCWLCSHFAADDLDRLVILVEARQEREPDRAEGVIGEVELPLE